MWTSLFPQISWFALFRSEYLTLCMACVLILLYINSFFNGLLHKLFMRIMVGGSAVYALIILFLRPLVFTGFLQYYEMGLFAGILYIVVRLAMAIRSCTTEQYILLAGLFVFFYGTVEDSLYYQALWHHTPFGGNGAGTGIMVCVFVQMLALFLRTQRDIYEARKSQQELTLQNSLLDKTNKMKTEFLGNISHELKTPLTIVANYTELARLYAERKEPKDDYIIRNMRLVSSETERIALMVSQLLDVVRIEDANMQYNLTKTNIKVLIENTINSYFPVLNKNHNTIKMLVSDDLPDAVKTAYSLTPKGMACILSPAASSYNVYRDFEEKGQHFKQLVRDYGQDAANTIR